MAGGIVSMISLYVFINVGMAVGIVPVVGVPLPLVSYGGTSIITTFLALGIALEYPDTAVYAVLLKSASQGAEVRVMDARASNALLPCTMPYCALKEFHVRRFSPAGHQARHGTSTPRSTRSTKTSSQVKTKVCLFFPDTYEVGMSHLGLRILYHILNSRPDTACERVFSPWTDYEERLRASGRPLTSLESNLPLAEFDIIGITLQYELSYSNILTGLELAGIPVRSADRDDSHPVIVAGGPCAVNPEPLSDFIDVFFIGEAEEAVHEIVDAAAGTSGQTGISRGHLATRRLLRSLARKSDRTQAVSPKNIETAPYPDKPLLPLMKPIHDRVTVEVARGCIRGCRFCQAGIIYRPYRERSPETVQGPARRVALPAPGYDELSLASLSSGDYSEIQPLIIELMEKYRESRVSVSLPSLRVGTLTPEMIEAIAGTRKTGFTLAPEAGTERLRRVINKPVTDLDLLDAAETIFRSGWSTIKLYFMIGLPTETDEDLDGIIRLANELSEPSASAPPSGMYSSISASRPSCPSRTRRSSGMGQAPIEEIRRKQAYLDRGLRRRGIALKAHDPETSLLEGAFARGDRQLGRVIEEAVRLGCRFDGWTEWFDFKKWTEAFPKCGIDASAYASRTYGLDEELPWGDVKSGVSREFLKREYQRAVESRRSRKTAGWNASIAASGVRTAERASLGKPARCRQRSRPGTSSRPPAENRGTAGHDHPHQDEVHQDRPHPVSFPSRFHDPVPSCRGPRGSAHRLFPGLQSPSEDRLRPGALRGNGERDGISGPGDRPVRGRAPGHQGPEQRPA